jgi:pimeloyl-ACP methyl ester carboxylesterase
MCRVSLTVNGDAVQDKMRNTLLRHVLKVVVFVLIGAPTAHARTLAMTLDGQATLVDITAPTANRNLFSFNGAVILAHGFTRTRETMAGHAVTLARDGYWVVVPDLPYLMNSRDNAVALRDLIKQLQQGAAGEPLDRFVLVGFSAGGLSALLAADAPGVAGYIGLDPFDRPGGVGLVAARKLAIPAFLLRGPSAKCNAYSIAEPWVKALPNLIEDRQFAAASHCDFEAPTDRLCTFVCGNTNPQTQAVVRDFLRKSVQRAMRTDLQAGGVARPAQGQVHQMSDEAQHKP